MSYDQVPDHYHRMHRRHPELMKAVANLGEAARNAGPLDEKTSQLILLAAAVGAGSQGATHSHARRALEAGASPEEVRHAVILLTSTVGFPTVSAGLSWIEDVLAAMSS